MSENNAIKYSVLCECLFEKRDIKSLVRDKLNLSESEYSISAQDKVDRFVQSFDKKYKKEARFKKAVFLQKNEDWLNRELVIGSRVSDVPNAVQNSLNSSIIQEAGPSENVGDDDDNLNNDHCINVKRKKRKNANHYRSNKRRRVIIVNRSAQTRKLKPFDECSERTKRRRCETIQSNASEEQMYDVFMSYLRKNSRTDDAKIIEKLRCASPERKRKILDILNDDQQMVPYTPNEALALMVDTDLSKHQYELIQQQAKSRNSNLYPSYYRVFEAKKDCYPDEGLTITETGAEIDLQKLLDHTTNR